MKSKDTLQVSGHYGYSFASGNRIVLDRSAGDTESIEEHPMEAIILPERTVLAHDGTTRTLTSVTTNGVLGPKHRLEQFYQRSSIGDVTDHDGKWHNSKLGKFLVGAGKFWKTLQKIANSAGNIANQDTVKFAMQYRRGLLSTEKDKEIEARNFFNEKRNKNDVLDGSKNTAWDVPFMHESIVPAFERALIDDSLGPENAASRSVRHQMGLFASFWTRVTGEYSHSTPGADQAMREYLANVYGAMKHCSKFGLHSLKLEPNGKSRNSAHYIAIMETVHDSDLIRTVTKHGYVFYMYNAPSKEYIYVQDIGPSEKSTVTPQGSAFGYLVDMKIVSTADTSSRSFTKNFSKSIPAQQHILTYKGKVAIDPTKSLKDNFAAAWGVNIENYIAGAHFSELGMYRKSFLTGQRYGLVNEYQYNLVLMVDQRAFDKVAEAVPSDAASGEIEHKHSATSDEMRQLRVAVNVVPGKGKDNGNFEYFLALDSDAAPAAKTQTASTVTETKVADSVPSAVLPSQASSCARIFTVFFIGCIFVYLICILYLYCRGSVGPNSNDNEPQIYSTQNKDKRSCSRKSRRNSVSAVNRKWEEAYNGLEEGRNHASYGTVQSIARPSRRSMHMYESV
jgi:hypothetical protein